MRNDLHGSRIDYPPVRQVGTENEKPSHDGGLAGFFANLAAKLDIGFGDVTSELRKMRAMIPGPTAPVLGNTQGTVIIPASGIGVVRFNLAGPDQGHIWYVKSIMVGGLTPITAAAGRADIFVSASNLMGLGVVPPLTDWRDQAETLPLRGEYSDRSLTCRFNEELYVVFSNATVGQQYVAVCTFIDYTEDAHLPRYS